MDKQTPEGRLRIYSILFIGLAILDAISIIVSVVSGELNAAALAEASGLSMSVMQTIATVIVIIAAIVAILKLFLGVQGYRQSKGLCKSTAHIKLAWVALVLVGLGLISSITSLIQKTGDWYEMFRLLASFAIVFYYIKEAKAVK